MVGSERPTPTSVTKPADRPYADPVKDGQERKHAALHELREADRVYRAAFQRLLATDDLRPSSFRELLETVERIEEVVRRLEEHS